MSLLLSDKKSSVSKQITINSQFLHTPILKKIVSVQLACQISLLKLYHFGTDQEYGENQIVKNGDKIQYLIASQSGNPLSTENRKKGIIYPDQLQKMFESSKIIVIKSANQDNIQKSKDHSVWATTFSNQERLKYFFNNSTHVILIFATNRSYEIKGIARMETEPDRLTDKSIWSGVSNIRLGGNFKIKWLRKKPLSLVIVQKNLGPNFKETIIKACDGQQLDPNSCKKLAHLFDTPEQPYYSTQDHTQFTNPKEVVKNVNQKQFNFNHSNFMTLAFKPLVQQIPSSKSQNFQRKQMQKYRSSNESESSLSQRKKKKIKKEKKKKQKKSKKSKKQKKDKKNRKKYSSNYSSSSNSSISSGKSSEVQKNKKKGQNQRKHRKQKKHKRNHS